LFSVIVLRLYFIYFSQGRVETHLLCGGICNNRVFANCPQSVPVKNFKNRSIIGADEDKSKVPRFSAHPVKYSKRPKCTKPK